MKHIAIPIKIPHQEIYTNTRKAYYTPSKHTAHLKILSRHISDEGPFNFILPAQAIIPFPTTQHVAKIHKMPLLSNLIKKSIHRNSQHTFKKKYPLPANASFHIMPFKSTTLYIERPMRTRTMDSDKLCMNACIASLRSKQTERKKEHYFTRPSTNRASTCKRLVEDFPRRTGICKWEDDDEYIGFTNEILNLC